MYSPSNNVSSVVAQLPYDIFAIPTIKVGKRVLILWNFKNSGLEILSFDLAQGKTTKLDVQLPVSVRYGAAIKIGQDKAYLFLVAKDNGSMWEMHLSRMSFKEMADISIPSFLHYPSVMTDGTFIYILAIFTATPIFTDSQGIFKIDPVSMTTEFLHVDSWLLANSSRVYSHPPPSVYVSKMKRIYSFGGESVSALNQDYRAHDEIFVIDLSPTKQLDEQIVTSKTSTEMWANSEIKGDESTTEASVFTRNTPDLDRVLTLHGFVCSKLLQSMNSSLICSCLMAHLVKIKTFYGISKMIYIARRWWSLEL